MAEAGVVDEALAPAAGPMAAVTAVAVGMVAGAGAAGTAAIADCEPAPRLIALAHIGP